MASERSEPIDLPPPSPRYSPAASPPYTPGPIDLPPSSTATSPQYSPASPQIFLPPPLPGYSPTASRMYSPGQFNLPTPSPTYTPTSSPYLPTSTPYSPTSPSYSPFNNSSWDPFAPRWRWTEAMYGSTPVYLMEEMIPVAISSIVDGTTLQGVEGINNTNKELNEVRIDGCSCPICYVPCTSSGNHRICCLPCGHVYGLSCINKWLQLPQASNKCPQCKRSCTSQDVRMLYVTCHDRETSLLKNIISRMEALKLNFSAPEQRDDALEKLTTGVKECVHALKEYVHALHRVSNGPAR